MTKYLFSALFISFQILWAQTKITVMDGFMEDQPLQNVLIIGEQNQEIGKTNQKGQFTVPADFNKVSLIYDGYEEKKLYLYGKDIEIKLQPLSVTLESTSLTDNDAEARQIIRKVIAAKTGNSIDNLNSYEYKSYSKFLVTTATDSLPYILFPKNKKDSSYNDMRKMLDESYLMMGERGMDHKFSKQLGTKNIVRASRISGTKLPIYEFAAMQPISNNFEEEKFKLFFREFINPISNSGLREYRYRISNSEKIENRDAFVISFFPVKRTNSNQKIKGQLWIDKENYALIKFYAENLSDFNVAELEMDYSYYKGYWFPKQQRYRMDAGLISYPSVIDSIMPDGSTRQDTINRKSKVWLHLTTSFKDLVSPVDFDKKEFKGYANEIDTESMDNPDQTLAAYRDDELTSMEKNTYVKIDSIGQKYKMDKNVKLMRVISSGGKYALGNYDLDLTRLFGFNSYEGFRLGLGGSTNYKFNKNISLNAYAAFGTKDKAFKYGGGIDWLVNKPWSGKLFANYEKDVEASGRNPVPLENNYLKYLTNNFVNIYNDVYYSYQKVSIGYSQDVFQNLSFRISGIYSEKTAEFEYRYRDFRPDEKFISFDTELALRWAPREQLVRTPYGKVTISSGLPVFYLTLSKGWNMFNADTTPTKIDFIYRDTYQSFIGRTDIQIRSGAVFGNSPIINLFEGMGNSRKNDRTFKYVELAGLNNFETMRPGEFYSDRYFMFNINQRIGGFKLFGNRVFPGLIYRGLLGGMKDADEHKDFSFKVPRKFYQEGGVEINKLFLNALGIGAYYRIGDYQHADFNRNFLVKLTFKVSFF